MFDEFINPVIASCIYLWGSNFVIIVAADGLAPKGAWPSAATKLTKIKTCLLQSIQSYQ